MTKTKARTPQSDVDTPMPGSKPCSVLRRSGNGTQRCAGLPRCASVADGRAPRDPSGL
jgi:hypothetical protein